MVNFEDLKVGDVLKMKNGKWEFFIESKTDEVITWKYVDNSSDTTSKSLPRSGWNKYVAPGAVLLRNVAIATSNISKECQHTFTHYVGFTQEYDFCTKCDFKKA